MENTTPLMRQYLSVKQEHKDKIVLFRMGDFFEIFGEDAEKVAPILNIALTVRNKKAAVQTKMCGFPHHSIAQPISKLLSAGFNIAICDQIESAQNKSSKGLMKRAVTRILSPGMVYDPDTIDQLKANYLASLDKNHLSFLDISTGVAFYYSVKDEVDCFKWLDVFAPSELVVTSSQKKNFLKYPYFKEYHLTVFDKEDLQEFECDSSIPLVKQYSHYPESVKRLIRYVLFMQGESGLKVIDSFECKNLTQEVYYSAHLYSHLEIFKNYEGLTSDTLFSSVNRTKTAGGARYLKRFLQTPLIDQQTIESRWDKIDYWISQKNSLDKVRVLLSSMGDSERKIGKIVQPHCNGRDLLAIAEVLNYGLQLCDQVQDFPYSKDLDKLRHIKDKIEKTIKSPPPLTLKDGGLINKGVYSPLDELIDFSRNSQKSLLKMEQEEQVQTGISSLKIRYNNIFGYYIEVRNTHKSKVPSHYQRKQTLTHAERYTTEALNLLEEKILSSRSKQIEMEHLVFNELKQEIIEELALLLKCAYYWSEVDVFSSFAFVSIENNYIRPQFGDHLKLVHSRHPVLEQKVFQEFIPNTIHLKKGDTLILTGPNMAGKSTLMRQVALTCLLAQSGFFVPASQATLPLFRKMFTRIGASDLLSQGLSTFMVEMKETAEILEKADSESLIILDEIGRGTATFDGMSLAQSILEFLTVKKKPILLSATHYHELTQLAEKHASIHNASMAIKEKEGRISFLYTLFQEPADKSYGIQVARLAGLPESVVLRAHELLKFYEGQNFEKNRSEEVQTKMFEGQKTQFQEKLSPQFKSLLKELKNYPLWEKSPLEATNQVEKWQKTLKNISQWNDSQSE